MNEVIIEPGQRTCRLEELFEPGFIELIRLAPRNPLVRGLILKLTGQMPPECATFGEIKEWAETRCQKRSNPPSRGSVRRNEEDGIRIPVDFSETEYGRADYSVPRSGTDEFRVGAEELVAMAQEAIEAGGGLDRVVDVIARRIEADAWDQCDPNLDDYGEYDYSNHDSSDSDGSDISYNKVAIHRAVLNFLQQRDPALAAQL